MSLVIIRGIPGSGKTTKAKEFIEKGYFHFEADMFHYTKDGEYDFLFENLKNAHDWCRLNTEHSIRNGFNVVVSNTFIKSEEVAPYHAIADKYNIVFSIIEMDGGYESIHDVPDHVIQRMKESYEPYVI